MIWYRYRIWETAKGWRFEVESRPAAGSVFVWSLAHASSNYGSAEAASFAALSWIEEKLATDLSEERRHAAPWTTVAPDDDVLGLRTAAATDLRRSRDRT